MTDHGTEADYMHSVHLAASGGEDDRPDPDFEVVNHRNAVMFTGSRAACWEFKRSRGGYVRPWSGDDEIGDWMI